MILIASTAAREILRDVKEVVMVIVAVMVMVYEYDGDCLRG